MLNVIDTGHEWVSELMMAAIARGYPAQRVGNGGLIKPGHLVLVPNQFPATALERDQQAAMNIDVPGLKWITDPMQIAVYEDKVEQFEQFGQWMPPTFVTASQARAIAYAGAQRRWPMVSKSAFGSASLNVRLLKNEEEARAEIAAAFGAGIPARRGPGANYMQTGYVLWQEFIPHEFTYRVTRVGDKWHAYKRFNYDDRPMACPSKVKQTQPVDYSDTNLHSLLDFSKRFTDAAQTKWVALDILDSRTGWKVLETSLAWARGNDPAGNAPFYGTEWSLNTQFNLLIDEIRAGAW